MSLIPRGVLLTGPPGTGKTLSARALAGKAPVPYFSISASEFVETFVGVGASLARDLVHAGQGKRAGEHLHRELDAIGRSRAGALARFGGGHDEREQTLNQIPRRGRRAVSRVRPSALPRTPASPVIGEELAAARALSDLSHQLLQAAADRIEGFEGPSVTVHGRAHLTRPSPRSEPTRIGRLGPERPAPPASAEYGACSSISTDATGR